MYLCLRGRKQGTILAFLSGFVHAMRKSTKGLKCGIDQGSTQIHHFRLVSLTLCIWAQQYIYLHLTKNAHLNLFECISHLILLDKGFTVLVFNDLSYYFNITWALIKSFSFALLSEFAEVCRVFSRWPFLLLLQLTSEFSHSCRFHLFLSILFSKAVFWVAGGPLQRIGSLLNAPTKILSHSGWHCL